MAGVAIVDKISSRVYSPLNVIARGATCEPVAHVLASRYSCDLYRCSLSHERLCRLQYVNLTLLVVVGEDHHMLAGELVAVLRSSTSLHPWDYRLRRSRISLVLLCYKTTDCCKIVLWVHASPRQAHRR